MHIKAWVPTDIQEPMLVRSQTTDASGAMSETNLTNIKVTPEQLQEMRQRRYGQGGGAPREGKQ